MEPHADAGRLDGNEERRGSVDVSGFVRAFQVRAPKLMWLLGAGASAAAGIPTAWHLIWRFKQMLYCTEQRISASMCSDLGDPALRARIQTYLDAREIHPPCDSPEEYAHFFEMAFPDEQDRQRYIRNEFSAAVPSYGHIALAALMRLDRVRLVWTTNFDTLLEDAVATVYGTTGYLTVGTPDAPSVVTDALSNELFPVLVKLHGDFRSRRLKNTPDELREQDAHLRTSLVRYCQRYGLAVIGYSGRDQSVMDALLEAAKAPDSFPQGFFWFQREDSPCSPLVQELMNQLKSNGSQAELIEVDTFDELMSDLLLLNPTLPEDIQRHLQGRRKRIADVPPRRGQRAWPVIRLNGFRLLSAPEVCRRIECDIGGVREVREAIREARADVIASRRRSGVIAFGSDAELTRSFEPFRIREIGMHSLEKNRLRYESAEHGLLYDAICRALERERPLRVHHRSSGHLLTVDPSRDSMQFLAPLAQATKTETLAGKMRDSGAAWAEAMRVRLEYRLDRLWFIVEPTIWVERTEDDSAYDEGRQFIRSRLASRYNATWNELLDAWSHVLTGGQRQTTISAFGISDGCDATFIVSGITGFSWREAQSG